MASMPGLIHSVNSIAGVEGMSGIGMEESVFTRDKTSCRKERNACGTADSGFTILIVVLV